MSKLSEVIGKQPKWAQVLTVSFLLLGFYYFLTLAIPIAFLFVMGTDTIYLTLETYTEPIFSVQDIIDLSDTLAAVAILYIILDLSYNEYKLWRAARA